MEKLQQLIEAGQFKITSGETYLWNCYGKHARFLALGTSDENELLLEIIFDNFDQKVYQASLIINNHFERWFNPEFKQKYLDECTQRGHNPDIVYENVFYTNCESFNDFVTKVTNYFNTCNSIDSN